MDRADVDGKQARAPSMVEQSPAVERHQGRAVWDWVRDSKEMSIQD